MILINAYSASMPNTHFNPFTCLEPLSVLWSHRRFYSCSVSHCRFITWSGYSTHQYSTHVFFYGRNTFKSRTGEETLEKLKILQPCKHAVFCSIPLLTSTHAMHRNLSQQFAFKLKSPVTSSPNKMYYFIILQKYVLWINLHLSKCLY